MALRDIYRSVCIFIITSGNIKNAKLINYISFNYFESGISRDIWALTDMAPGLQMLNASFEPNASS